MSWKITYIIEKIQKQFVHKYNIVNKYNYE